MYEIGDEVIYQGADKSAYKRRGVVASIEDKDGKTQLTVAFEDGEEFTSPIDDWSRAFTNAAKNAKFKVGDVVRVKEEAAREIGNPSLARKTGRIKSISGGYIEVDGDLGDTGLELTEHELTFANSAVSVRTTNATVRNALNARAANASVCNEVKFTNPNYNPVKGIKYLEEHFSIFDPKVAKAMIDDAMRKGVKIPSGLLAKAKAAGMIANAAKNAKYKVGDMVRFVVDGKPKTGTITRAYGGGHDMYDVKVGTETFTLADTPMTIAKAANGSACNSTNATVRNAINARTAKNAESATDVAGKAGDAYRSAYNELAGCAAYLERIASIGLPNDLSGNDEKTAAWAKKKAQKVRDIMARLDQGRL